MSGSTVLLEAPSMSITDLMSTTTPTCAHCGSDVPVPDEAHRRIKDLESQVRLLNAKAAAAVDKLADYEDEVRSLRSAYASLQHQQQQPEQQQALPDQPPLSQIQPPASTASSHPPPNLAAPLPIVPLTSTTSTTAVSNPSSPPRSMSRLASLSSFLPGRKRDTALLQQTPTTPAVALFFQNQTQSPSTITPPETATNNSSNAYPGFESRPAPQPHHSHHTQPITLLSLQTSLENERSLRLRAESSLTQTQTELEELTASLFGQANEMVAEERKARAKLEERVKVLEDRDGEKRRRLERLEKALERIERVRTLVREEQRKSGVPFVDVVEVTEPDDGNGADADSNHDFQHQRGRLRVV